QVGMGIERRREARRHEHCRIEFVDDRGPLERALEVPGDDPRRLPVATDVDLPLAVLAAEPAAILQRLGHARPVRKAARDEVQVDQLDDAVMAAVAVGLLVLLLEARGELLQRRLPVNRQLVRLAEVAQLGKTLQLDAAASVTLALERTARFALEALPQRLRLR